MMPSNVMVDECGHRYIKASLHKTCSFFSNDSYESMLYDLRAHVGI